jgi:hypothetical protein
LSTIWNYEELVQQFEESLLTRLRGHGVDSEYLETWVPDDDTVKSLLNMVEAVEIGGGESFSISVSHSTLSEQQIEALSVQIRDMAVLSVERDPARFLLKVTNIGTGS